MNYTVKHIHISELRIGDTVIHNGEMKTLTNSNFHYNSLMGHCIENDSYNIGYKPVQKVIFNCKDKQ